jgi:hypothetical protein
MEFEKAILVAEIIDQYEVVLNVGSADGTKIGDQFLIYGLGKEVFDPATNESLGKLEIVRGKVSAKHIQERICIARSIENTIIPGKKKIVKHDGMSVYLGRGSREEIEEGATTELKELIDPKVGDFARPI